MTTSRAINKLKSVWGSADAEQVPRSKDGTQSMKDPPRKRSRRTARLDLRLVPEEKRSVELMAVREGVSINEIFSRMLALYEREHGRVELTSHAKRDG